uniref:Uncharacterized protein n=1 Tax=Physcomitrium patens TaxID=3218 RepID=A0A2K1IIW9_PHYPA|nr:hypothetical protein PHYPA_027916 [Physcomitrium patens]
MVTQGNHDTHREYSVLQLVKCLLACNILLGDAPATKRLQLQHLLPCGCSYYSKWLQGYRKLCCRRLNPRSLLLRCESSTISCACAFLSEKIWCRCLDCKAPSFSIAPAWFLHNVGVDSAQCWCGFCTMLLQISVLLFHLESNVGGDECGCFLRLLKILRWILILIF